MRGFEFNVCGSFIELKLTKACIKECSHAGDCDKELSKWVKSLKPELEKIPFKLIEDGLLASGGYSNEDIENCDKEENFKRFLLIVAGDCKENKSCRTYWEGY